MYIPRHFAFPDGAESRLHDLIEAHNFGLLVAGGDDGAPEAAHLPFVLDRARGPLGTLIAHVARANPIWRRLAPGREVLIVFQGPHAYVSPDWYAASGLVPTWNYVAVHGYGVPRLLDGRGGGDRGAGGAERHDGGGPRAQAALDASSGCPRAAAGRSAGRLTVRHPRVRRVAFQPPPVVRRASGVWSANLLRARLA